MIPSQTASTKDAVHIEHAVDALRAILVNQKGQNGFKQVDMLIGMNKRPELEGPIDRLPTSTIGRPFPRSTVSLNLGAG